MEGSLLVRRVAPALRERGDSDHQGASGHLMPAHWFIICPGGK